jgi:hypothetical protein
LEGEDIFKPTTGNRSLHLDNNDNDFGIVNFTISKTLVLKAGWFRAEKFINTPDFS